MRLFRSHGLGNDYLVLGDGARALTPALVRALCDRHRGVGGDGVLEPTRRRGALRIWNPDGSEAEKSGNGLRIFAHWLVHAAGAAPRSRRCGRRAASCAAACDGDDVRVEMGVARVGAARALAGVEAVPVDVGNPHHVVFAVPEDWRERRRARLEHAVPGRTNVQFVRSVGPSARARAGVGARRGRDAVERLERVRRRRRGGGAPAGSRRPVRGADGRRDAPRRGRRGGRRHAGRPRRGDRRSRWTPRGRPAGGFPAPTGDSGRTWDRVSSGRRRVHCRQRGAMEAGTKKAVGVGLAVVVALVGAAVLVCAGTGVAAWMLLRGASRQALRTSTGDASRPVATHAAATAHALDPLDSVPPAPRSHTRARTVDGRR